ncbi:MAG: efflux RND transporter periplasmic adaptor subunit [Burkholderiales bacterium]|nr:efflux RND transporter periplasmic adaptor subunit [Burkholderiales bacterium]
MKTTTTILLAVLSLGAVGGAGYWFGSRSSAVHGAIAAAPSASAAASQPRKLLYYRNPMGLPDTSSTPKKDPMGMDYIAVYEDEETAAGPAGTPQIRMTTDKVQKLGVRTEAAALRALGKTLRAAGRVEPDERRMFAIAPKFEGYVERLHVNVTGQPVSKGQALFEVYSPELFSAQREYLVAMQGMLAMKDAGPEAQSSMKQLAQSSLMRLRNWDLSAEQIQALVGSGEVSRTVTFRSPVSGIVTEKKALQGMRFMPGEGLYQVTDLSAVWVVADVFERDIAAVKLGTQAGVKLSAYPGQVLQGRITYIYPTMKAETRTIPVRIELPNPRQQLKPAMFAQVEMPVGTNKPVLTVPDSAVIDSGTRRLVLVQRQEGRFEPREVELGLRGDAYIEVTRGVKEGEQVVVAANFLIDAESNLKAAIGGLGGHSGHGSPAKGSEPPPGDAAATRANPVGHRAEGVVEGVDPTAGTVSLNHGPVPTLKWPAMTMDFKTANASMLAGLKTGQRVSVEFVERQSGEYVLTSIAAAPANPATTATPAAKPPGTTHSGH